MLIQRIVLHYDCVVFGFIVLTQDFSASVNTPSRFVRANPLNTHTQTHQPIHIHSHSPHKHSYHTNTTQISQKHYQRLLRTMLSEDYFIPTRRILCAHYQDVASISCILVCHGFFEVSLKSTWHFCVPSPQSITLSTLPISLSSSVSLSVCGGPPSLSL